MCKKLILPSVRKAISHAPRHSEARSVEESLESGVEPNGKMKTENYDFRL